MNRTVRLKSNLNLPIVARLAGTNLEEGLRMLEESGVQVERAEDLGEAAQKAVAVAEQVKS